MLLIVFLFYKIERNFRHVILLDSHRVRSSC